MKKTEPQSVGEIIHDVFRHAGMEDNEARQRALMMWGEVVGPGVNRMTVRRFVTDEGVMHVFLTSGSVKSELQFMRTQIRTQLNAIVGKEAITDLIIH